jgi:hypothetical protein
MVSLLQYLVMCCLFKCLSFLLKINQSNNTKKNQTIKRNSFCTDGLATSSVKSSCSTSGISESIGGNREHNSGSGSCIIGAHDISKSINIDPGISCSEIILTRP